MHNATYKEIEILYNAHKQKLFHKIVLYLHFERSMNDVLISKMLKAFCNTSFFLNEHDLHICK